MRGTRIWRAVSQVDAGEDDDGEEEVGDRPGCHDGGALPDRLIMEALTARSAALIDVSVSSSGVARRVTVAEELDVAAQRNSGQAPAGAVAVVEADNSGPKPIENAVTLMPHHLPDEEVTEFVDEDDDDEHEEEGKQIYRLRN